MYYTQSKKSVPNMGKLMVVSGIEMSMNNKPLDARSLSHCTELVNGLYPSARYILMPVEHHYYTHIIVYPSSCGVAEMLHIITV